MQKIAERGRDFYTDGLRGRLSERVRRLAQSAVVAGRINAYTDGLVSGLKQYALGAVAEEFRRARELLLRRRAEVDWLSEQVGEFLHSNDVDDRATMPYFKEGRIASDVRVSLERSDDLAEVARSLPRDADRYREQVGKQNLFAAWSQPYGSRFLHPLQFLDDLSRYFIDKLQSDEQDSRRRGREIAAFVRRYANVPVCFQWFATDGLPSQAKGSVCPVNWRGFTEVGSALAESGFANNSIPSRNSERLYLYRGVLGIPAELLEKPSAQMMREVP